MSGQEPKKLKKLTPKKTESENGSNAVRVLYVEDAEVIRDFSSLSLPLRRDFDGLFFEVFSEFIRFSFVFCCFFLYCLTYYF